jgi:hypothetical protein
MEMFRQLSTASYDYGMLKVFAWLLAAVVLLLLPGVVNLIRSHLRLEAVAREVPGKFESGRKLRRNKPKLLCYIIFNNIQRISASHCNPAPAAWPVREQFSDVGEFAVVQKIPGSFVTPISHSPHSDLNLSRSQRSFVFFQNSYPIPDLFHS